MYTTIMLLFFSFLVLGVGFNFFLFYQEKKNKKSTRFITSERLLVFIIEILIAVIGLSELYNATGIIKKQKVKEAIAITGFKSTLFLSIAASMNAFVVGMGMGFCFDPAQFVLSAVIIMVLGFIVSLIGVFIGRQNKSIPARMLVAVEALLLVEIAVKLFFELA